jgi:L-fuconolactonase
MFGSDWPVCLVAGSYQQVHDALQTCLSELSADERARVWGGTAREFYALGSGSN